MRRAAINGQQGNGRPADDAKGREGGSRPGRAGVPVEVAQARAWAARHPRAAGREGAPEWVERQEPIDAGTDPGGAET